MTEPDELVRVIKIVRELKIPYRLIAGGSNVVFSDHFFAGLLIHFLNSKSGKTKSNKQQSGIVLGAGGTLGASASLPLGRLVASSIKAGLAGLEALSGIPGTVGGAVVGNAGAYGQGISDHLVSVQIFDGEKVRWLKKSECEFAYRESVFKTKKAKNWLILRAKFKLNSGNKTELLKKSREIIKIRNKKYQPGLKCPGSFFKNVSVSKVSRVSLNKIDQNKIISGKIPAGYLLETVGARGIKLGKLEVASFHGNLIINNGGATSSDVQKLAKILKNKVYKKFGIKLEEEVRFVV